MKLLRYINTCVSKQIKVYKTVQSRPKRRLRPLVFGWGKNKGLLLCRTCLPALIQWVHLPPIFFRRKHLLKAGSRSARINKNQEIYQLKFWNKLILKKLLWVSAVCQLCHKLPSPAGGGADWETCPRHARTVTSPVAASGVLVALHCVWKTFQHKQRNSSWTMNVC